jgi:hypothetical protein
MKRTASKDLGEYDLQEIEPTPSSEMKTEKGWSLENILHFIDRLKHAFIFSFRHWYYSSTH